MEQFGVTDPSKFENYMEQVEAIIFALNHKARDLIKSSGIVPKPIEFIDKNFLEDFKSGLPAFDKLPHAIKRIINDYNKEFVDVSYEHKIKLLMRLVSKMHDLHVIEPEVVDAFQKEVRRNYEINFDAQFSHNHAFYLKVLESLALVGVMGLAAGIVAIIFPHLLAISFVSAVTMAAVSTSAITLFAIKAQPVRPMNDLTPAVDLKV